MQGEDPDWQDFVGIVVLLFINSTISFIEENNAGNAAAALMAGLAPKAKVFLYDTCQPDPGFNLIPSLNSSFWISWMYDKVGVVCVFEWLEVLRDGRWSEQEAEILVPGDVISIKLGDIIPADARLLEGDPLKIDQAALTGESLPVTRNPGDEVFSGSTCKQGEIEAVVIATGVHTFFGKAAHLVDNTNHQGHFQKVPYWTYWPFWDYWIWSCGTGNEMWQWMIWFYQVLTAIGNFCICSIALGIIVEIVVMYPIQRRKYRDGINNLLVLLIGGIPIAMPTVLSVTMAIGSHRLSKQGAITKRMTAIEEMAGMDVLCSDKTGTLTLNKLTVDKSMIEVGHWTKIKERFKSMIKLWNVMLYWSCHQYSNLQIFSKDVDSDMVILLAARASRVENQDAIDACIVGMLADPSEVCWRAVLFSSEVYVALWADGN